MCSRNRLVDFGFARGFDLADGVFITRMTRYECFTALVGDVFTTNIVLLGWQRRVGTIFFVITHLRARRTQFRSDAYELSLDKIPVPRNTLRGL